MPARSSIGARAYRDRVVFKTSKVASAGVNPAGKLTAIIAGMAAGADCIDDLDLLRSGGMGRLFGGVYPDLRQFRLFLG